MANGERLEHRLTALETDTKNIIKLMDEFKQLLKDHMDEEEEVLKEITDINIQVARNTNSIKYIVWILSGAGVVSGAAAAILKAMGAG